MHKNLQKLDHVAICVENLQPAVEWYVSNLGAEIEYCDETWAMLAVAGTKVALTIPDQHPPHIAFTVDNIECLGENPKRHRDGSYFRYVNDPEGNTIELIYWKKD